MKTIIRIEHPSDGIGLFRSELSTFVPRSNKFSFRYILSMRHSAFNTPWEDNITDFSHHHFCAFKTLEQLRDWMNDDWMKEIINDHGFRVYMIDVSEYLEGNMQIAYKKSDILQIKDISNLFL